MKLPALLFTLLLVLTTFGAGYCYHSVEEYNDRQFKVLNNNLSSMRNAIKQYIESRRIYIGLYADTHVELLSSLLHENVTDDDIAKVERDIKRQVKDTIPEYLSFMIRTASGEFIPDEFNEKAGGQCRQDIDNYSAINSAAMVSGETNIIHYISYKPIIHPNTIDYHIDMISPWRDKQGTVHTLNVLLSPSRLASILKKHENPQHRVVLLKQDSKTLIEITSEGDRSILGEAIHITDEEYSNLLGLRPVPDSHWDIAYVVNQSILDDNKRTSWIYTTACFAFLWLIILGLYLHSRKRHTN